MPGCHTVEHYRTGRRSKPKPPNVKDATSADCLVKAVRHSTSDGSRGERLTELQKLLYHGCVLAVMELLDKFCLKAWAQGTREPEAKLCPRVEVGRTTTTARLHLRKRRQQDAHSASCSCVNGLSGFKDENMDAWRGGSSS